MRARTHLDVDDEHVYGAWRGRHTRGLEEGRQRDCRGRDRRAAPARTPRAVAPAQSLQRAAQLAPAHCGDLVRDSAREGPRSRERHRGARRRPHARRVHLHARVARVTPPARLCELRDGLHVVPGPAQVREARRVGEGLAVVRADLNEEACGRSKRGHAQSTDAASAV